MKPPGLLEVHGPLFMSSPAISHVQYRLTAEDGGTRLEFSHRAIGQIPEQYRDVVNFDKGWGSLLARIRKVAEQRQRS